MKQKCLRKHRKLGRSKLVLSMMTDDHVFNEDLQLRRKFRERDQLLMQHFQFYDHVPEELATGRVAERTRVGEFVDLADVMQERTRKHQVAIHGGIIPADQIARCEQ